MGQIYTHSFGEFISCLQVGSRDCIHNYMSRKVGLWPCQIARIIWGIFWHSIRWILYILISLIDSVTVYLWIDRNSCCILIKTAGRHKIHCISTKGLLLQVGKYFVIYFSRNCINISIGTFENIYLKRKRRTGGWTNRQPYKQTNGDTDQKTWCP